MGWGGAVASEYRPSHGRVLFLTKNYLAGDILLNDPVRKKRYRMQGDFHSMSLSKKTTIDITWDKFSDIRMPGDFKTSDFEINTANRSLFLGRHEKENGIASHYELD